VNAPIRDLLALAQAAWGPMSASDLLALARAAVRDMEAPRTDGRTDDGFYSSLNLPPDIRTRERFAKLCRGIPGASLAGRVWRVPSAAWWAHRRASPCRPPNHHRASVTTPLTWRSQPTVTVGARKRLSLQT
jgi:hypothetical protein